jgi:hypothetical protein
MRKRFLVLLTVTLTLGLLHPIATAAPKPGTACKKVGQTSTSAGIKYTCIKSGKKLVWNKGVEVKKATPSPTPTTEPSAQSKNLLATDSRITPTSALTPIASCKTGDMTPDYAWGGKILNRNGFPRPDISVAGKKSAKILVVPIIFKDLPFREEKIQRGQIFSSDLDLLNETIPYIKESFKTLSVQRFEVEIDVLPKSQWFVFDRDNPLSGVWGVDNFTTLMEMIEKEKPDFKFDGYDTFAFITGNGMPGQSGLGSAQASHPRVKNSQSGFMNAILMVGGITSTTLWVHEFGHSLFSFEDLYLFSQASTGAPRKLGELSVPSKWDLMSDSSKVSLLGWNKFLIGWLYDSEVRCISEQKSSIHYLSNRETSNDTKLLTINLAPGVTLAAEAKNASGTDKGLLLYLINTHISHGEGPILTQNTLITKGQSKSWLGWQINVLDSNEEGVLIEAVKTDIDKFVPPPPKPAENNPGQPTSPIRVTRGDIVPTGSLQGRATWNVTGHESYRLYVTDVVDFQKVYFETGYVNDSRNPLVIDIKGLVCKKEFRTMTEFFTEKNGKGERLVMPSFQLRDLPCP